VSCPNASLFRGGEHAEIPPFSVMPEWFYRASITTVSCPSVVMLHAFVKKTKDTLEQKLIIARKRMKEVRNG